MAFLKMHTRFLLAALAVGVAGPAVADEIWVSPVLQKDMSGMGIAVGAWPATPTGMARLALSVPDNLQVFQGARIVLISQRAITTSINVLICSAEDGQDIDNCAGPFSHSVATAANTLHEIDISESLAPFVAAGGQNNLAIVAAMSSNVPRTHIVGMRFNYAPTPPAGTASLGANTFSGTQTAPAFVGDGSRLTNLPVPANVASLGGNVFSGVQVAPAFVGDGSLLTNLPVPSGVASLNANAFTGTQTISSGNLGLGASSSNAGNLTKDGRAFLHNFRFGNTFLGVDAGNFSMTESATINTGVGAEALNANMTGRANTAVGAQSLSANTDGTGNTGVGSSALVRNRTGTFNVAMGAVSLASNRDGTGNVAIGSEALPSIEFGDHNVGIGYRAGLRNESGFSNIYLGANVFGVSGESNTMYLGRVGTQTKTVIAGVRGATVAGAEMVVVDPEGRLGSVPIATLAADTVGSVHVIDDSLTAADLGPASVGGAELAPASVDASKVAFNYAGSASPGGAATNAERLDGLDASAFAAVVHGHDVAQINGAARLAAGNIFSGGQTINSGNLDLDASTVSGGNLTKDGLPFLHNFRSRNTFLGVDAGNFSMIESATDNTGVGTETLKANTTGNGNTAVGVQTLSANTEGSSNTALGRFALSANTTGGGNTALGTGALRRITTGFSNVAMGLSTLANTDGSSNVAIGSNALFRTTSGDSNVGIGALAGLNSDGGSNNIYLGSAVYGVSGESNTMYLGKVGTQTTTIIAGVRGSTVIGGEMVVVDATGRFGSAPIGAPATDTVGSAEVIDDSLTAADLGPASVGASELAPASVDASKVAFNYAGSASPGGAATNAERLDGLDASAFAAVVHGHDVAQIHGAARLDGANIFAGAQTINSGNIDLDASTASAGNLTKDGRPFLHNFRSNTFLGDEAGNFNMTETATSNTGIGTETLKANTTGHGNAAVGNVALFSNTTGRANTAMGMASLFANTEGIANVALGYGALQAVTSGHYNVGIGHGAGANNDSGSHNIYLGTDVHGVAGESHTMYLGNNGLHSKTVIAGVRGTAVTGGQMVVVDPEGRLGSAPLGAPATDTVGTAQVIDDSLTAADLGPASVGSAELAPGSVDASKVAFNYAGSASPGGAASDAERLDGLDATAFANVVHGHEVTQIIGAAQLAAANSFTHTQTIDGGNLDLDHSSGHLAGNIMKNGTSFLHDSGVESVFLGVSAGNFLTAGGYNAAMGFRALTSIDDGDENAALGHTALGANTSGNANTAIGAFALQGNRSGDDNTAAGKSALVVNDTGSNNTAIGAGALIQNTIGNRNTALGVGALVSNVEGSDNIAIGYQAGILAVGSGNIFLGAHGQPFDSATMRLGRHLGLVRTFIGGVRNVTTGLSDAIPVVIDSDGQLGTMSSSIRYKEDVRDMGDASRRLFQLRPVTFRYTQPFAGGAKPIQYGLVAEEVMKVFPELAVRNKDGGIDTVHYEKLAALLLNELQRQEKQLQHVLERLSALEAKRDDQRH